MKAERLESWNFDYLYMKIHRILPETHANGPGCRFAVWVQGCSRRCPGCFNPETHDFSGGCELKVTEIISQIPAETCGITVSGGEPFEQTDELFKLLKETGRMGLNRLVYTGYTYEELSAQKDGMAAKCLCVIDTLIDGAYKKEISPYIPWTGSGNQRLLHLTRGKIQKIYKISDIEPALHIEGEILIDQSGNILATGIIDSKGFWVT